jgi:UDP-N-acetyl-D-mannosaminuronic acid transferase (WecB/TagA/CpsF family)
MPAVAGYFLEKETQMFQRVLAASAVAIVLVCMPMRLAAQEREIHAAEQARMSEWLSGVWGELAAWLAGTVSVPPTGSEEANGDGSGYVDPNG